MKITEAKKGAVIVVVYTTKDGFGLVFECRGRLYPFPNDQQDEKGTAKQIAEESKDFWSVPYSKKDLVKTGRFYRFDLDNPDAPQDDTKQEAAEILGELLSAVYQLMASLEAAGAIGARHPDVVALQGALKRAEVLNHGTTEA